MARLGLDDYFMGIAGLVRLRGTCARKQVGAVFVRENRIISTGFNGVASGAPHCLDVGCVMQDGHCIACSHAEVNGIINAGLDRRNVAGSTIYTTTYPCSRCLIAMRNARVGTIIYGEDYPYSDAEKIVLRGLTDFFDWRKYEKGK